MATETLTRLVDDLDGGVAERTVAFSWDKTSYEIDLSRRNIAAFEKALKPYLGAARAVRQSSGGRRRRGTHVVGGKRADLQAIREWARANGHEVSERGRIAATVVAAYDASR
jgi:nucleoid-associated protein Lsr2